MGGGGGGGVEHKSRHVYLTKGVPVTERTRICIKKHQRGDNSKRMKVRALILYDTSSCLVLHNCEVLCKYSKRFLKYIAETKMFTDGRTPGSSLYPPNLSVGG